MHIDRHVEAYIESKLTPQLRARRLADGSTDFKIPVARARRRRFRTLQTVYRTMTVFLKRIIALPLAACPKSATAQRHRSPVFRAPPAVLREGKGPDTAADREGWNEAA
jgi:hypothetical protein